MDWEDKQGWAPAKRSQPPRCLRAVWDDWTSGTDADDVLEDEDRLRLMARAIDIAGGLTSLLSETGFVFSGEQQGVPPRPLADFQAAQRPMAVSVTMVRRKKFTLRKKDIRALKIAPFVTFQRRVSAPSSPDKMSHIIRRRDWPVEDLFELSTTARHALIAAGLRQWKDLAGFSEAKLICWGVPRIVAAEIAEKAADLFAIPVDV